ncbi:MAG: hypothetical protein ACLRM9_05875 [Collinsella aerofaciens]
MCGNGLAAIFGSSAPRRHRGDYWWRLACGNLLPMVITGMHVAVIMIAIANSCRRPDSFIMVATTVSLWVAYGAEIATWLKLRNKEEKSQCAGYLVAQLLRRRRAVHLWHAVPLS